jgi:hypothetical protein
MMSGRTAPLVIAHIRPQRVVELRSATRLQRVSLAALDDFRNW